MPLVTLVSVNAVVAVAVISLGHSLGVQVVAEGIEEERQAGHLRRSGCDFLQGFLYSAPLSAVDMGTLLQASMVPAPR